LNPCLIQYSKTIYSFWWYDLFCNMSKGFYTWWQQRQSHTCRLNNIFHKNREISILTIKKKTARLTLLQEATERTRQGETQNKTKTRKTLSGMNESASLTPVQGPSTVACMIVT
jgi:hypothetical protein